MSTQKRPLSAAEKRQWEKMVLDLNGIFPAMGLQELAKVVREADGSFDAALAMLLRSTSGNQSSGSNSEASSPHSESVKPLESAAPATSEGLDSTSKSAVSSLRERYKSVLPSIIAVLGQGAQDEETILAVLEEKKGDEQQAVLALLAMPSVPPKLSALRSSRDALRLSAAHMASSSSSQLSSGIEELPVNVDLKKLDETDTPSSISAPTSPSDNSSSKVDELSQTTEQGDGKVEIEEEDKEEEEMEFEFEMKDSGAAPVKLDSSTDFLAIMLQEESDRAIAMQLAAGWGVEDMEAPPAIVPKSQPPPPHVVRGPVFRPSAPASSNVKPVSQLKQNEPEEFDRQLLAEFVAAHTPKHLGSHPSAVPSVVVPPSVSRSVSIAVKRIKRYYASHSASLETERASATKLKRSRTLSPSTSSSSNELSNSTKEPAFDPTELSLSSSIEMGPSGTNGARVPVSAASFDISAAMDAVFKNARAKTAVECLELQRAELQELKANFSPAHVHVSESAPTVVAIALEEPEYEFITTTKRTKTATPNQLKTTIRFHCPLHLHIVASLPTMYPDLPPIITVRSFTPNCPIGASHLDRLAAHLTQCAKSPGGAPRLVFLAFEADEWLRTDMQLRKIALMDYRRENAPPEASGSAPILDNFGPLDHIFNFSEGFRILDPIEVMQQQRILVERAVSLFANGPTVVNPPTPGNPDAKGSMSKEEFPVRDETTGEVDEEKSLRALGLTVASVRVVLQHYNWNLGKLSTEYLKALVRGTYELFLSEAGVAPVADRFAMQYHLPQAMTEVFECPICMDYYPFHGMFGLVCGHLLCKSCYSEYADFEISRGSGLSSLSCPSPNCKYIIDQTSLAGLLSASRWSQYVNMAVGQFVQANPTLKWCPSGRGCQYLVQIGQLNQDGISAILAGEALEDLSLSAAIADSAGHDENHDSTPLVVQCKCSYTFCNLCSRVGGHYPASCSECDFWAKKHPDDEQARDHASDYLLSVQFIRSHTKTCPGCFTSISKDGGCAHMMCKSCRYEFCWTCGGRWSVSHYACLSSNQSGPSEDSSDWADVPKVNATFVDLYFRNQTMPADFVAPLQAQLLSAMYRTENEALMSSKNKNALPRANDVNSAKMRDTKLLTIEDVPKFVEALEFFFVAHYVTSNACKTGFYFFTQSLIGAAEKNAFIALISRCMTDLQFMAECFATAQLRKFHLHHLHAALHPLKLSVKLLINHVTTLRMRHLATLAQQV